MKMSFDYKKSLKKAFQNHIFSSDDKSIIEKEIIRLSIMALVEKPEKIIGFLRFQSPKQKLVQFLTQSLEIKTGDMLEEFFTDLLSTKFTAQDKYITYLGKNYKCDQLFLQKNGEVLFIEQKIRDDHDTTKKTGQVDNFETKILGLASKYKVHINAYEWFIDDNFKKHEVYYQQCIDDFNSKNASICTSYLKYGGPIINDLCGVETWDNFVQAYEETKVDYVSDIPSIINNYDFDNDPSSVIFDYIIHKRKENMGLFFSESFKKVREEFFPSNKMAEKLYNYFSEKKHSKSKTARLFVQQYHQVYIT